MLQHAVEELLLELRIDGFFLVNRLGGRDIEDLVCEIRSIESLDWDSLSAAAVLSILTGV